jgi:hypothetical protein
MSVRMEQLGSNWTDFHEIWYLSIFRKSVQKFQVLLMSEKITGTVHEEKHRFLIVSRSFLLSMRNVPDKFVYKIKTHNLRSTTFSRNSGRLWDNAEITVCPDRPQMTNDNGHCMLGTLGYKYTLRICIIYCFSTTTIVARTHLNFLLYIHCLSCLSFQSTNK